jgi:hypothetical protein
MKMHRRVAPALLLVFAFVSVGSAQRAHILKDVKTIQVNPTVVSQPDKVKEDFAPSLIEDSLRNALKDSNFEVGDAPLLQHDRHDDVEHDGQRAAQRPADGAAQADSRPIIVVGLGRRGGLDG